MNKNARALVIFDIDGVLIDNVRFDAFVTETLISCIVHQRHVSRVDAEALWNMELALTRQDHRWYDYDFHLSRLGVRYDFREAHELARNLILPRPGIPAVLIDILEAGMLIDIATDAVEWVAAFKLSVVGFSGFRYLHSSSHLHASKVDSLYWRAIQSTLCNIDHVAFIDNNSRNLAAAARCLPNILGIRYENQDHASMLCGSVSPLGEWTSDSHDRLCPRELIIHDHSDLLKILRQAWRCVR